MNTPPPLPQSSSQQTCKSFFHSAATASLVAIPLSFVISISASVLASQSDPQTKQLVTMITGFFGGGLVVCGFAAGIIALFGISRHGTKGILGKALCGIIVPLLLVAIAVPNFIAARAKAQRNNQISAEDHLQVAKKQINAQAPKMVDAGTRLDGAEVLPGRVLVYKYTAISKTADEIKFETLNERVRPIVLGNYKDHPDMKEFRDNKVTLTYRYSDKNGLLIGEISVGPQDLIKK